MTNDDFEKWKQVNERLRKEASAGAASQQQLHNEHQVITEKLDLIAATLAHVQQQMNEIHARNFSR